MSLFPTANPTLKPDILYPFESEKISMATSLPCSEASMLGFLASKPKAL